MAVTVAQLGARVLRKLGLALVADAARPADAPVVSAASVAARVLLELGLPVAEASRPADAGIISQTEIANRALRAVGINPITAGPDLSGAGAGPAVTLSAGVIS